MSRSLIIRNSRRQGGANDIQLFEGKTVRFGTTGEFDVLLTPQDELPDLVAHIWYSEDLGCILENISRRDYLVALNGNPVHSVALLEVGDQIQIGADWFQIHRNEELPPPTQVMPPVVVVPKTDYSLQSRVVNSGVSLHRPVDPGWSLRSLAKSLLTRHSAFLLANFRLAALPPVARLLDSDDLFRNAPPEIREIYSLHVVNQGPLEERLNLLESLAAKDAVVLAVPERTREECLVDAKLYFAWFARASVLELTLNQGSRMMGQGLMQAFRTVVVKPRTSSAGWIAYSKGDSRPEELAPGPDHL